jgi:hypothetical protein
VIEKLETLQVLITDCSFVEVMWDAGHMPWMQVLVQEQKKY